MIQQVLSTYVPLTLPMMEDEVVGEILKSDVKKEDDTAPPVALWDSWFYISWKSDTAMMHPLAENWQHILGIFWKFSLRRRKRRQLRSWIAFGKRYQSSSHITHKNVSRADLSVTSIKTEGLTTIKYISGTAMGDTVTFIGVFSRDSR